MLKDMVKSGKTSQIFKKYHFRWDVLDAIIGGRSLVDLPSGLTGFTIKNIEHADRFLMAYGFDLSDPIEQAELLGHYRESLNFVRNYFLQPENPEGLKIEIPRKILELTDIRELLLMANLKLPGQSNDTQGTLLMNWGCSMLKMLHALSFVDKDIRSQHFSEIQKQIFDRYYKVIHRDDDKRLYMGLRADDPMRVDLDKFETKPRKSRESILLKLLHKPETVSEDIFDQVGIRFVTPNRVSALRVVKYLKDEMIIMPGNIKPSRSRNTLVDTERLKDCLNSLRDRVDEGSVSEEQMVEELESITEPPQVKSDNPHSSEHYRAIQFTCRQLIKLANPIYDDLKELKSLTKSANLPEEASKILDRVSLKKIQREVRFFYPYEVQIMDKKSFEENEQGKSSHAEYKKSQVQSAMKRVMGNFGDVARG